VAAAGVVEAVLALGGAEAAPLVAEAVVSASEAASAGADVEDAEEAGADVAGAIAGDGATAYRKAGATLARHRGCRLLRDSRDNRTLPSIECLAVLRPYPFEKGRLAPASASGGLTKMRVQIL
jgi:hypothetical protein